jgi:two-component sensor histidine kinase
MAGLVDLARVHAPSLDTDSIKHLQRLIRSWDLLADFCFADLLLFLPMETAPGRFVTVAQRRPSTSQTLYRTDHVGSVVDDVERPLVAKAWNSGSIEEGEITISALRARASVRCVPVSYRGERVALLTREAAPWVGREPGELERVYLEIFDRFAGMIVAGEFPFEIEPVREEGAPRVGDGVVLLDEFSRVSYASPNAVSSLHRAGVHANAEGMRLSEVGLPDDAVRGAFSTGQPVTTDVERDHDVTILMRVIPLLDLGRVSGAVVLMRDISDVRRRDLLLLSKDATIREIHHRVKNNLQTISSLLRLQGRRLSSPEAKAAIEESVRRIRSIALVHETLSRDTGDDVVFEDIVRPLVREVEEGLVSPDRPVRFEVIGEAGKVPADVATPLAVVVTELLQNAVDHAFPVDELRPDDPLVSITLGREDVDLHVRVADAGVGIPDEFRIEEATGLGLSIVRALVTSELGGTLTVERGMPSGTVVHLVVPLGSDRLVDRDPD